MTGRVLAWLVLAVVVYAGYVGVKAFKNPWASGLSVPLPVMSVMPVMPDGCAKSEKCT